MADTTDTADATEHVKPFVQKSLTSLALHFSIAEIQSRMLLADPIALDLEYTRTMMGFLLFMPEPKSIAMLGLGGGSLAKFCYHHLPRTQIQVAEINPHVIALRDAFQVPPDDGRFAVLRRDGAGFIRDLEVQVDVLMVDGFDAQGQPARLSSQRFYDDCLDALRPGGLLVVNLHYGHRRRDVHIERIRRSFDNEVLVVDDGELCNSVVFACKGQALPRLGAGLARRPKGVKAVAALQLRAAFARVAAALESQYASDLT